MREGCHAVHIDVNYVCVNYEIVLCNSKLLQ
jgi:hypothetical protein